ncbi:MAG TPA: polymer-forming cytoskeletal protein [Polyangiales bacterium]|jgi:cytoskeletal protein CcmA (bactofilin family)|nr:polymer-forming cytoskeletal protein [Polyangiales bacterium]
MSDRDWSGVGELQALLGPGAEFEGTLVFQGRIRIEGRFKGEIRSDDILILGPSADVEARVHVGALIVRGGSLRGDVHAKQLVEIYAPAKVHGDIEAPQVYLEKGAVFEGQCTMVEEKPAQSETRAPAEAVPS